MCDNGEESGDEAIVINQLSAEMCISDQIMYITWKKLKCLHGIDWESYSHACAYKHECMCMVQQSVIKLFMLVYTFA